MSSEIIRKAYLATEEDFLSHIRKQWLRKPQIAAAGSCCLVSVVCGGILYVANAGDSRAVLGVSSKGFREISAVQLSAEHNAAVDSVREELRLMHPEDSNIVLLKHNVWRVKGIIQVRFRRLQLMPKSCNIMQKLKNTVPDPSVTHYMLKLKFQYYSYI